MFAIINGVRLHYEIEGTGPDCMVIALSGIPMYQRLFSAALRRHVRLIFVDLRGSGASESGVVEALTLDTLIDDIDALRQALGLARIVVIGHSLHGWLALAYAHKYPQHTAGVVLIGTPPRRRYDELARAYWETMATAERQAILRQNLAQLTADTLAPLPPHRQFIVAYLARGPERFRDPRFDWAFFWDDCVFDMAVVNRVWGVLLKDYDPTATFPAITCPVMIAGGIYDFPIPPLVWYGEKDRLVDATYHVFEQSGHNPMYDEQALFDARLLDWLRETREKGNAVRPCG